jgi:hypothetical protein
LIDSLVQVEVRFSQKPTSLGCPWFCDQLFNLIRRLNHFKTSRTPEGNSTTVAF